MSALNRAAETGQAASGSGDSRPAPLAVIQEEAAPGLRPEVWKIFADCLAEIHARLKGEMDFIAYSDGHDPSRPILREYMPVEFMDERALGIIARVFRNGPLVLGMRTALVSSLERQIKMIRTRMLLTGIKAPTLGARNIANLAASVREHLFRLPKEEAPDFVSMDAFEMEFAFGPIAAEAEPDRTGMVAACHVPVSGHMKPVYRLDNGLIRVISRPPFCTDIHIDETAKFAVGEEVKTKDARDIVEEFMKGVFPG